MIKDLLIYWWCARHGADLSDIKIFHDVYIEAYYYRFPLLGLRKVWTLFIHNRLPYWHIYHYEEKDWRKVRFSPEDERYQYQEEKSVYSDFIKKENIYQDGSLDDIPF